MIKRLFLLLSLIVILAACGGTETAAPAALSDPGSLPLNISAETAAQYQNRDDVLLIDVREQYEYDESHIPGITLIPMSELEGRLSEIPTDKEVIVTCRSGNRSSQVTSYLQGLGYDNVHNMEGGILAWQAAGLPVE
ncbi:MAG: rhodanese-like domain-containing protein [Anaerolineales bacterium]|nr:rhodanese-like domain-containing protein [Anaerolineales bacterium]